MQHSADCPYRMELEMYTKKEAPKFEKEYPILDTPPTGLKFLEKKFKICQALAQTEEQYIIKYESLYDGLVNELKKAQTVILPVNSAGKKPAIFIDGQYLYRVVDYGSHEVTG